MEQGRFAQYGSDARHQMWGQLIGREEPLYLRPDDIRSDFARDYGRLLHCTAYRRLKHKTQLFFAPQNDHICTRIEHVNHVMSISTTIAKYLGLNADLVSAIAIGHDLGHAPFGHHGEKILSEIVTDHLGTAFWHERNSLHFVDDLETLIDPDGAARNLNLTYAVRDGIISHCGEVDEEALRPRTDAIDLRRIEAPNQYSPFTWEGCVVKLADKIAYLGRDIEDAVSLKVLRGEQLRELARLATDELGVRLRNVNNTALIRQFIIDLCESSSPDAGIRLSPKNVQLMRTVREFSMAHIYQHARLKCYKEYAAVVLRNIYETMASWYRGLATLREVRRQELLCPLLGRLFGEWLVKYSDVDTVQRRGRRFANRIVYDLEDRRDYSQAVVDFMSGMTDNYALRVFGQLTTF
jgi:dGTPase